jgi:phenylpropionate dioxygenase-like ring-hydroxylating dioxygenase large terminal subunit
VHKPSRGDGPIRFGKDVEQVPGLGPSRTASEIYTSPEHYELERTRVFRDSWYIVGRGSEVPAPGDFKVWEEMGETVVISRQASGELAAFHNVCQHRGARITPESGHCDGQFVCPWHGWRYDTTGAVAMIPDRADFDPAEIDGLRAPQVAVSEHWGFIWIYLAGPEVAPPLVEYLAEIEGELAPFEMQNMKLHATRAYEMPVNWKAVGDAFLEVYHVGQTHRETIGGGLAVRDTYFELFDWHSMFVVPYAHTLNELYAEPNHQRDAVTHYLVYPFSIFNCSSSSVQAFTPIPQGPNSTKLMVWNLVYPDGDEPYNDFMDTAWEIFQRIAAEDAYVAEQAGATRQSMGYQRNLYNARECRITHLLANMDRHIARSDDGDDD